ncbi:MAG: tRNA (adenosine(37)-N6)-threonylcarbamoyltransferase complex transferase subunit TsaD, partial [Chloroflexia bacterium]|nr:tRNA (adenosine(37)-N6)-threonylcarbamoyltransferase complex transferase subunit TsaD [Chloroflexia bacterium]
LIEPFRLPAPDSPVAGDSGPFPLHRPVVLSPEAPLADLAAGFQAAIVDVLATKLARAAVREGAKTVLLAGGVAANRALRDRVGEAVARHAGDLPVRVPDLALCTDNAAMIAGAAFYALRRGEQVGWEAEVSPRLPLPGWT